MLHDEILEIVDHDLSIVARRIWECIDTYPDERLPRRLAEEFGVILDALDELYRFVEGDRSKFSFERHPKCQLLFIDLKIPDEPLVIPKSVAEKTVKALDEESERINHLIEKVRGSFSRSESKRFTRLCAKVIGNMYVGIVSPLRHRYPKLNR